MDGKIAKYGASPEVDKWHKVRINAAGDGHVYFYLDGQLRWKVKDDKYNHGVARFGNGCRNFEMKNLMVKETSVAHSQKWVLGLAKGSYGSKDIGKDEFNKIFQQSSSAIIKRVCSSCSNDYKEIYYRRYTNPSSFTPYDYMKQNWFSKNNAVNKDFGIFSSYADAVSRQNPWKFCNYNDPGIGFPRDCGKTGGVGGQWNSWTRGGQAVAYYVEGEGDGSSPFVVSLGAKNGAKGGRYEFRVVKASSTSGKYQDIMIKECSKYGMKPVCDHPHYCKSDSKALYIGQTHHIAYPGHRNNNGYGPWHACVAPPVCFPPW